VARERQNDTDERAGVIKYQKDTASSGCCWRKQYPRTVVVAPRTKAEKSAGTVSTGLMCADAHEQLAHYRDW